MGLSPTSEPEIRSPARRGSLRCGYHCAHQSCVSSVRNGEPADVLPASARRKHGVVAAGAGRVNMRVEGESQLLGAQEQHERACRLDIPEAACTLPKNRELLRILPGTRRMFRRRRARRAATRQILWRLDYIGRRRAFQRRAGNRALVTTPVVRCRNGQQETACQ